MSGVTAILPAGMPDGYTTSETIYIEKPVYREVTREVIVEKPVYIYKEAVMWTWTNIGIVVLITLVTVKFILPRFNWRFGIRWFVRLFWKPAKKEATTIKVEWEEANKE
jgi:hypothetical protein